MIYVNNYTKDKITTEKTKLIQMKNEDLNNKITILKTQPNQ